MIGGGKRPPEAMKEFVLASGATKADLVIIPWASESLESAEIIRSELMSYGPGKVTVIPQYPFPKGEEANIMATIKAATGVFFTGGDQNQLMHVIAKNQLRDHFKEVFQKGVAFGGTSAGTAVMSEKMLTGNADLTVISPHSTELATGLGLLPSHVIVDQHFIVRQRFNRLAGLILEDRKTLGIGIDEGTALWVRDNKAEVIGPTQVIFFSSPKKKGLSLQILSHQDTFQF